MLRENPLSELTNYIKQMDASEQSRLLRQFKRRDASLKARALDKKQRALAKGRKLLTEVEIAAIVRSIRKANAQKKT
jgi:hypothetical protein